MYTNVTKTLLDPVDECAKGTDNCKCDAGLPACKVACINTLQSYSCECSEGYALGSDGLTCSCESNVFITQASSQINQYFPL